MIPMYVKVFFLIFSAFIFIFPGLADEMKKFENMIPADPLARQKKLDFQKADKQSPAQGQKAESIGDKDSAGHFSSLEYADILKNASVIIKRKKGNTYLTRYTEDLGSIEGFEPLDQENNIFGSEYRVVYEKDYDSYKNELTKSLVYRLYQQRSETFSDIKVNIIGESKEAVQAEKYDFSQLITQELRNQIYNAKINIPYTWDESPGGSRVLFHAAARDDEAVVDTLIVKVLSEKTPNVDLKALTQSSVDLMINYILPGARNESIEYFDISDSVRASLAVITEGRMKFTSVIGLVQLIYDEKSDNVYSLEITGPAKDIKKQKALFRAIGKTFTVGY
jgi:hypothetical protein